MKQHQRKALLIFISVSFILALVFFTLPINLFDGVIIEENGISRVEHERPLSLSYFIGLGYDEADMANVADFYLTTKGKILAFIFIFGFPAVLAYRIMLKSEGK